MDTRACSRCLEQRPVDEFDRIKGRTGLSSFRAFCMSCRREYMRQRYERRRLEGGKPYRRHVRGPEPTRIPSSEELAWAAGFLEGEGSFVRTNRGKYFGINVIAKQVNPEPPLRLQAIFGGSVRNRAPVGIGRKPYSEWVASGSRARSVIAAVWTWLSAHRKRQINAVLFPDGSLDTEVGQE